MAPNVVEPGTAEDARDAVHRAVEMLAEGKLVVFPTETVYGLAASALSDGAVAALLRVKQRRPGQALALTLGHAEALTDYCPDLPAVGRRLAQRCWPGPLTLVVDGDHPHSLVHRLPPAVRRAVAPQQTIGLRVPDHPFILSALRLMPGPLVLTSANLSGQSDTVTAEEVVQALGEEVAMVLSDGRSKYGQASTVVRVEGNLLRILRKGVLTDSAVLRGGSLVVLLACTGNTCRSPMAQLILQKSIADRLQCDPKDLPARGVLVLSAGVAAATGYPASPEAVRVMAQRGLDLSQHESRPLTGVLVRFADLILTMTRSHHTAIVSQWPEAAAKTFLVGRDQADIPDPIGGTEEMYDRCAAHLETQLPGWVERLDLQTLPRLLLPENDKT